MSFGFGVILGIAATLYAMVFMKQKSEKEKLKSGFKGISIFINFLIVDKEKAIQQGVEGKISGKIGKGFLRDKIAARAGNIASKKVSDDTVADKMSGKMSELLPDKMAEMGIMAEASKVYGAGSFFVMKLTFLKVDLQKLLDNAAGAKKASMFEDFVNLLGGNWARESMQDKVLPLILSKIQSKLPEKMTEKMAEKGLMCDIVVKSEADEALYFFQQTNPETVD